MKRVISNEILNLMIVDYNSGMTIKEISNKYNIKIGRIYYWFKKFNFKIDRYFKIKGSYKTIDHHPIYIKWISIKARCYNNNSINYKFYGGKGIKICEEWKSFLNFYNWCINNGYDRGLEIDRIDSDRDYCPENCQFLTKKENLDKTIFKNKTSKYRGIRRMGKRYNCRIMIHGNNNDIGNFINEDIAGMAYDSILKYYYKHTLNFLDKDIEEMDINQAKKYYKELDKSKINKVILCVDTDKEFLTVKDIVDYYKISIVGVYNCLSGKTKTVGGYKLIYKYRNKI